MYRTQEMWWLPVYRACAAYLYLAMAVVLFLLLFSYNPADLPEWIFFSTRSGGAGPAMSLGGGAGAAFAGSFYFLLGGAAYLIPAILLGFGLAKLASPGFPVARKFGWVVLCLLACSGLLHLQSGFLAHWKETFHLLGPGGWLGYAFAEKGLVRLVGANWAWVMLVSAYVLSVMQLAGVHPVMLYREVLAQIRKFMADREARRLAKMSETDRLNNDAKGLERERRRLEKQLKKRTVEAEPALATDALETPLPGHVDGRGGPERKIIDTSMPVIAKVPPKPVEKPPVPSLNLNGVDAFPNYEMPDASLLDEIDLNGLEKTDHAELEANHRTIVETLEHFGIKVQAGDITKGPTITRYELYPDVGVRVDRITALERDLARATKAERINILAPIPGKDTVGIELANSKKVKVTLRELLTSEAWTESKAKIPIALGKDVYGRPVIGDLTAMPHCLVAGTTGSGKSVCINAMIASILFKFAPDELRFIMIDPKVVEMQMYNALPHLAVPVVTDPKKVIAALEWVVREMEQRYKWFAKAGVRNISGFNARPMPKPEPEARSMDAGGSLAADPDIDETDAGIKDAILVQPELPIVVPRDFEAALPEKLPYLVIIIDELADLMQTAPADVENLIARITQMARAAGIHMIVATQTPRADVVTGIIKANIPTRIAFQVASKLDSRVILDQNGADRLLGQGDMLYQPPGTSKLTRAQGVLVTDEEIQRVVDMIGRQAEACYEPGILAQLDGDGEEDGEIVSEEMEEWITKAVEVIRTTGKASTSHLQRRLGLGYNKAARIVDILELRGVLGPQNGVKSREILFNLDNY